ncbi:tRNA-dependent cyclodipeptide synthase [Gaetbulibacter jejuensis]|uniref:tRNA-dependent cyclodipeptide synthase n=1 Tax=Gaetbulibacter jejuensis TaxID=584607 RepID=UPI00300A459D
MRYKIKYSSITPNIPKELIYNENCYVGISINNDFFWGKHTDIFFEWIEKRFNHCKIVIGDYIHRHNEIIFNDSDYDEAVRRSLYFGKQIKELLSKIEILQSPKFKILHWNEIYKKNEMIQFTNKINNAYLNSSDFKYLVDSSAKEFISRQVKANRLPLTSYDDCVQHSVNYIKEELSVFCYLIKNDFKVQVYPGSQLPILKHFASNKVDLELELKDGIYIDLKTVKIK